MEKVILVGGKAGQGIAQTSWLIGEILAKAGYFVFNYKDYPSLIRGGHNFNVLRISDKPVYSHLNLYDIIIALDENTISLHYRKLKKDGFILTPLSLKKKRIVSLDTREIISRLQAPLIYSNDILVGYLFKLLGFPLAFLEKVVRESLGSKNKLLVKAVKAGYEFPLQAKIKNQQKFLVKDSQPNYFLNGSEAIGAGALAAGLDLYIAYPMTPATPVLHYLAKRQIKHNIGVLQLENEIAVANAALGASYGGASVMIGTSGGGFALMGEAMSLQGMSEVPLVAYLSQRTSPSSGVPTYSSQGDLKFALNIGHGEFPRIVVAPGDAKEAFYRTIESFYLARKYRMLAILVGDKHLGESNFTFTHFEKPRVSLEKYIVKKPLAGYKSYLLTQTGVSPRAVPGEGAIVKASSYEHDDRGYTTENPVWVKKMNDKRMRKLRPLKREIDKLEPVTIYGKGPKLIIGWGSTKGAILDSLPQLKGFRFLQVSYISPFPVEQVKKEIKKSKEVILAENNVTGLLGQVIAEKTGIILKKKVLKYDARPFTPDDIISGVRKIV